MNKYEKQQKKVEVSLNRLGNLLQSIDSLHFPHILDLVALDAIYPTAHIEGFGNILLTLIQSHTLQYSTVKYYTVQYCTTQYDTVLYSTVLYCTIQCPYSTVLLLVRQVLFVLSLELPDLLTYRPFTRGKRSQQT